LNVTALHPQIAAVTRRIAERSARSRGDYLDFIAGERDRGGGRPRLSC
jgi:phosphogluconate dehydratase